MSVVWCAQKVKCRFLVTFYLLNKYFTSIAIDAIPVRHFRGPPFPGSAIPTVRLTLTITNPNPNPNPNLNPNPPQCPTVGMADPGSGEPVPLMQAINGNYDELPESCLSIIRIFFDHGRSFVAYLWLHVNTLLFCTFSLCHTADTDE